MTVLAVLVLVACDPCLHKTGGFPEHSEQELAGLERSCEDSGGTSCDAEAFIQVNAAGVREWQ